MTGRNAHPTSAIGSGQPFVEANRSSKASGVIKQVAERVMGASDEDFNSEDEGKKSLLGGFDLKSLLAKKNKSDPVEEPAE